jgi:hypothetical protein
MADVILCYASEDAAVAGRLAAAVAAQGYSLWSEDELTGGTGADITDRISPAKAAIVIWSETAAASEWVRAEANFARGQKKLIQVSIDDRPPPLPFRPVDMISIANWRGDEAHPGWRRISAGLAALCGPAPARKAAAPIPARAAVAPSRPPAPAGRRRGWLVAGLTLALLAAVAIATFVWMRGLDPVAREGEAPPIAASDDPVAPAPSAETQAAAPAADPTLLEVLPPEPPASEQEPPTRTAEAPPPRPAGPRISRENSQNMRLFCERAGRGTPQCRTFARQLREARR